MSEINNTQVDNTEDIDVAVPMSNLTEYSDIYSKKLLEVYGNTKEINQL